MRIEDSAHRHDIEVADMLHAIKFALRIIEQEYDGEIRQLVIGPDRSGFLLEIVVVTDEPIRIIHADQLRPKFFKYLRKG